MPASVNAWPASRSHPSRGAWIEIIVSGQHLDTVHGRTPHGVRGLKFDYVRDDTYAVRRTPHGVRGLKLRNEPQGPIPDLSHPSRGAWIEIDRGVLRYGLV